MQLSQEVKCPNINQENQITLKVGKNDEKSLKTTKNAPNCDGSDNKSEKNDKKLNGQSIPRNHNISKTNDELHVVSHTLPRNTQDISNN